MSANGTNGNAANASTSADEAPLLAARKDFSALEKCVHFISHSLGAMPNKARAYANQYCDEWENDSITSWNKWLPAVRELSDMISDVLTVPRGNVAIFPNVSSAQACVASCFSFNETKGRFAGRNKVVYDELNFSTVHYVWREHERRGAKIHVVPSKDGVHAPIDALIDAIDETTLLVPISHVLFRSSGVYDVARVVEKAKKVGALVLLDCYQSAGTLPLTLGDLGIDMACGGSVKWACGGPGAGYLYVRKDLLDVLSPMNAGWFAHAEPFAFDMGPMRWAEDAWKLIGGTMAIPAVYTARAGWENIVKLGVSKIRRKSLRQTRTIIEEVKKRGFHLNTPDQDALRGGTVCFDFDGADAVSRELIARRFFHDYRPKCGIRISPHFYTTDEEVQHFLDELDQVRAKGATTTTARAY